MKSRIKLSFLLLTGILVCFSIKVNAQSNRNISVLSNYDVWIDTILVQMTLEEKVDMFFGIRRFSSAGIPRLESKESLVDYRWFDTKNIKPMFPGLTYTTFQYAGIQTDKAKYKSDETIKVSIDLTNSGKADADEVVQVYVHRLKSKVFWPYKELKAFERVNLKAGETKKITLEIPVKNLRYWDEAKYDWILENGAIEILVGTSSGDIRLKKQVDI